MPRVARKSERQKLVDLFDECMASTQGRSVDLAEAVDWILEHRRWDFSRERKRKALMSALRQALMHAKHVDPQGREVRSILSWPEQYQDEDGTLHQRNIWAYMDAIKYRQKQLALHALAVQSRKPWDAYMRQVQTVNDNHLRPGDAPIEPEQF